jgi:5-methylcytosine-specific restriction enzyme A
MTTEFHKTKRWQKKRQYILHRDGYLCLECKKYGKNTDAKIVHHVLDVNEFPELRMKDNNLVSLCASCHNKQHPEKGGHFKRY